MIRYVIFLWLLTSPVYSQMNPANLTHYRETDGNNIYDVITDQYGFIWMATGNGLIRFDGHEFTRFYHDPNDSTSISQILIYSILEDRNGRIWIGCVDDINVYDPKSGGFKSYNFKSLIGVAEEDIPVVTTITQNSNGTLYFGVVSGYGAPLAKALLSYDEEADSIFIVPDLLEAEVKGIFSSTSDPYGNSYFAGSRTLFRIDPAGKIEPLTPPPFYNTEPNPEPVIHRDDEGTIWMSFEKSLVHAYDPKTDTYEEYRFKDETFILDIQTDSKNRIWLATDKGLLLFDGSSESENYLLQESIINSVSFDSFGTIWLGTYSNGLMKYEEKSYFRSFRGTLNDQSDITPGWVSAFYEHTDGNVWFTSSGFGGQSGLDKLEPETGNVSSYPYSSLLDSLYAVFDVDFGSDNSLILSSASGLFELDLKSMRLKKMDSPGIPDSIRVIFRYHVDRLGTEWIGTAFGLFERRSGQTQFKHHDLSKLVSGSPISNEVIQIVESELHGIWLLTNFGLFSVDPVTNQFTRHGHKQQAGDVFISQDMNSIYDQGNGTVWVGTWQGGLSRYRPETGEIQNYTRSDGLPSMGIQYILHDQNRDELWLSTFEGISKFDMSSEEFINYTTDDGIHSQLFADGAGLITKNGEIFFGGSGGVTFFRPEDITQNSMPPIVSLTGMSVLNQPFQFENGIQHTERVQLNHHQNTFSIGFAAIHFSNPGRNKVRYKLENHDIDWHESRNQRSAYYSGLAPGTYTFKVIAANSNGVWNMEGASIEITILPPWWRTWWAYGFYGIFFIGAVFALDRSQRERILRKERERAREKELVQAKEIETAYENLKAAQDQLIQQEKLASLGQLTAGIAHEIKNPLNFVNNFASVSVELVSEAKDEVDRMASIFNIQPSTLRETLGDIDQNLQKIVEHGTRADGIVKSMLMHSRGGTGKKEPTDLNSLVKEYANLSYHGMRAGKNPIDANILLELDESIGNIPLIAEDFSRVILNICNNGFDALRESATHEAKGLVLRTKRSSSSVTIEIEDNGPGIPADIKDKILQPFFTTKRGTQGTGLGLSITQDIIKAHGGLMEIESEPGRTVFRIKLMG